jgi:hypothetical protein
LGRTDRQRGQDGHAKASGFQGQDHLVSLGRDDLLDRVFAALEVREEPDGARATFREDQRHADQALDGTVQARIATWISPFLSAAS